MISYEWVIETVDQFNDIQDVNHADSFDEAKQRAAGVSVPENGRVEIGIVRNRWSDFDGDLEDRTWAYIDNGALPSHFQTAGGAQACKVPEKFRREVSHFELAESLRKCTGAREVTVTEEPAQSQRKDRA